MLVLVYRLHILKGWQAHWVFEEGFQGSCHARMEGVQQDACEGPRRRLVADLHQSCSSWGFARPTHKIDNTQSSLQALSQHKQESRQLSVCTCDLLTTT